LLHFGVSSKEHNDELIFFFLVVLEHFTAGEANIKIILYTVKFLNEILSELSHFSGSQCHRKAINFNVNTNVDKSLNLQTEYFSDNVLRPRYKYIYAPHLDHFTNFVIN
jgi:hypothetical protein